MYVDADSRSFENAKNTLYVLYVKRQAPIEIAENKSAVDLQWEI